MGREELDRSKWLLDINGRAVQYLDCYGTRDSVLALHRPEQRDKWGFDNLSGYYWYLNGLVRVLQPRTVVELGRCLGTSALFMLAALPESSRLITVDIEERACELSHCLDDPRLTVLVGNDLDLSIYDGLEMGPIDLLFVDTGHTYEQATKEWELYRPLLSANALVAFDDIQMNDMGRFWDELDCAKINVGYFYHYTGFGIAAP